MQLNPPIVTANEVLLNNIIRHDIRLDELATGEVRKIVSFFNRSLIPDLTARMEKAAKGSWTETRVRALQKSIKEISGEMYQDMGNQIRSTMTDLGKQEATWHTAVIERAMPVRVDLVTPPLSLIRETVLRKPIQGLLLGKWMEAQKTTLIRKVNQQISLGLLEGEGIDKIVRRINGTRALRFKDGIMNRPRHEIASIVRTAVMTVSNNVRMDVYQANSDIIKGLILIATLDTRCCEVCGSLDGNHYGLDDAPTVPIHWMCRCVLAPRLRSWKELGIPLAELPPGTRASNALTKGESKRIKRLPKAERDAIKSKLQGQVPVSLKYPEWIKKQSKDVQIEALGKGKAALFRAGKVNFKEFVTNNRRIRKLSELTEQF